MIHSTYNLIYVGYYLGRSKVDKNKVANYFPLFLSDEGINGDPTHSKIHDHIWSVIIPAATGKFFFSNNIVFCFGLFRFVCLCQSMGKV